MNLQVKPGNERETKRWIREQQVSDVRIPTVSQFLFIIEEILKSFKYRVKHRRKQYFYEKNNYDQ